MTDWKKKLAAYLHDPPSKALDIRNHGERSEAAFRQAGFVDTEIGEYFAHADHAGAAADRMPFPQWQSASLSCSFDGVRNAFHHPLGGPEGQLQRLAFHAEFKTVEQGIEGEGDVQPVLTADSLYRLKDEDERWRARFFAHWRLWAEHATEKDYRLALLPADTRIPDHSIWTHMQVTSALAGCVCSNNVWQPAFLKFQLGPVQDFIAAARSIRDLWSGSYLLSWLTTAGLKALSAEVGPDAVIFPNLVGQPLFDLHWREQLWQQVEIGNKSVWDSLGHGGPALLTPNLPNVFLALVPADRAATLGKLVEDAIRTEWSRVASHVWQFCDEAIMQSSSCVKLTGDDSALTRAVRKERFDAQVKRFLSLSWQTSPWPDTLEDVLKLADGFGAGMPMVKAHERIVEVKRMAEEQMPLDHRDRRYYTDETKTKLNNIGLGWSVILAVNSWQLDAVRKTRSFEAWTAGGWKIGTSNNKDSLNGQDEAVAGGKEWFDRCASLGGIWPVRFKNDDWIGAVTLIKRLWDLAYLKRVWGIEAQKMPNTRGIAAHDPFAKKERFNDDEQSDDVESLPPSEKYFAVLALDGDEIGRWISGEKTPPFASQLADYKDGSGAASGAMEYFTRDSNPDSRGLLKTRFAKFLKSRRPLSPSYHLQFSESLSNFALYCARPIVEAFDGRLIYAGGDDVLAMLPADCALECARALRMAFRGESGVGKFLQHHIKQLDTGHELRREATDTHNFKRLASEGSLLNSPAPGYLQRLDRVDQQEKPIPFLVPGPAADCSVGIAIAHFKSPLQDVVRAAQAAEKRAKNQLGRSAVAVTLMKRSGETIRWGCQWDSGGLDVYEAMMAALRERAVSAKFPHRVVELLDGYLTETSPLAARSLEPVPDFPVVDIALREFLHALDRQGEKKDADSFTNLARLLGKAEDKTDARTIGAYLNHARQHEAILSAKKLYEKLEPLFPNKPNIPDWLARLERLGEAKVEPEKDRWVEFGDLLEKAKQTAPPNLIKNAKTKFDRELTESPLQALIGLCQTVAFIARNLPNQPSATRNSDSENDSAQRQTV